MLVAVDMKCHGGTDDINGEISTGLRPAPGVQIRLQIPLESPVMSGSPAKYCLTK